MKSAIYWVHDMMASDPITEYKCTIDESPHVYIKFNDTKKIHSFLYI